MLILLKIYSFRNSESDVMNTNFTIKVTILANIPKPTTISLPILFFSFFLSFFVPEIVFL